MAVTPCGTVRLDELTEIVMLLGAATATRVTVPANRPMLVTVIVLVELAPIDALIVEGLAVMEKSPTFNVSVTVWVRGPLLAVKVRPYVPPVEELNEQVRARGAFGATDPLFGHNGVKVLGWGAGNVIVTVPLNPPMLVKFSVEVVFEPERNGTVDGLAENVKSRTFTVIWIL